ncbi:UDP-glucose 4-epimerase [Mucilaginibacter sp. PPCGB 2223]|uniref:NAD-dependent epimerase/dehydratase family protein n=1 Tax=Mucilaginibacter sp. PPCGB 2223 TaxID=1886027 RepID=UPI0008242C2E|nr:NAD(P)-dependent oxidoreductase [Mucilaginibacter sp. PPCGB 2223]OCX52820.1 UDP-glucose 4-epimerase [Mucilaginibacter sp. PPCGB 2223]
MSERVLITGASGFVGYHLIAEALKNNLEVIAAIRRSSKIDHLKDFDIQYCCPDFTSVEALKAELEKHQFAYIIHAAGITAAKNEQEYNIVNAQYTYNLALAASQANISLKKFVFLGSLAAMGPLPTTEGVITENTRAAPVTAYGKSKLLAEQMLAPLTSLPLIILRPTAVYGPRDEGIFIILKTFAKGFEPYIGKAPQQLSFVYVKDLAALTVRALQSDIVQKTYNVSDGKAYDRYELARLTKQILNKRTLKIHLPVPAIRVLAGIMERLYAKSDKSPALNIEKLNELTAANWICSVDKANRDLNYLPKYDLEHGLTESLQWYKLNHLL